MRRCLSLAVLGMFCAVLSSAQAGPDKEAVRKDAQKAFDALEREAGGGAPKQKKKKKAPKAEAPAAAEKLPAPVEAPAPVELPAPPPPAPEPAPEQAPPPVPAPVVDPGVPVTLYWHMADDADVYLNGEPLRDYSPSFRTRGDEAPRPAFSTAAVLRDGDVITVGGRRGGSYGLMLVAKDALGRVVFKTDQESWKVYDPGDKADWHLPSVAQACSTRPVTVQSDPWGPQKDLNSRFGNKALSIWGSPGDTFAHLLGVAALAPLSSEASFRAVNYPDHLILHRGADGFIALPKDEAEKKAAVFKIVPGLADKRYVSLEAADKPGYYLARQGGRVLLLEPSIDLRIQESATFKPVPGLADESAVSFEASDEPGLYIRHKSFQLCMEGGSDELFKKDSTFKLVDPL